MSKPKQAFPAKPQKQTKENIMDSANIDVVVETAAEAQADTALDSVAETQVVEETVIEAQVAAATEDAVGVSVTMQQVAEAAVVEENKVVSFADSFNQMVIGIKASNNTHQKGLVFALEDYIYKMSPDRVPDPATGALAQKALWWTLKHILTSIPREEFYAAWNVVSAFFYMHSNGAFNQRYVYRFANMWDGDTADFAVFHRILDLIIMTADASTRKIKMKQINFDAAVAGESITEEARARLVSFYM